MLEAGLLVKAGTVPRVCPRVGVPLIVPLIVPLEAMVSKSKGGSMRTGELEC